MSSAGRLAGKIRPGGRQQARAVMEAWQRIPADGDSVVIERTPSPPGVLDAPWRRDRAGHADHRVMLEVQGLSIRFGGVQALSDVALTARTGEVTGIIGPNGAGKSTLFNCLSGVLVPDAGDVTFDGAPLRGTPAVRARRGLGRTFQTPRLFPSLSVRQNLILGCEAADAADHRYVFDPRLRRLGHAERAEVIARLVGYDGDLSAAAGSLAFGEVRTVELARALCGAPRLLMLDEPASGLDTAQAEMFVSLMRMLADMGLALLLIEHDMALVMGLCERITVLDFGVVIAEGSPHEVQTNEAVVHAYLGKASTHA